MELYLLIAAGVIFACVLLNKVSMKLGMPALLAFILLGMVFGSDGLLKIPFDDYLFAERICSTALICIMFYGGFGTNWKSARPVAAQSLLLSTLGVLITAGLVGLFCRFALGVGWLESFLIGSVIGSTDAASVFSILRSKKLGLRYRTDSLLEVESGSNDPCSYMLTAIFIAAIKGEATGGALVYMVFSQVVYGVAFGAAIAAIAVFLLRRMRVPAAGFGTIFVVGIAVLAYAAPTALGGNGYLSAYIVGIVLGNANIPSKKTLVNFFDGLTGLMQMLIFFLLGLLSFPSKLPSVALPGIAIALFLTLVARPAAVFAILSPFHAKLGQKLVVSWAGLRGAASIVFAIVALTSIGSGDEIFHIVFFIVLFSILVQGSLLPVVSKKLGMIDESADVMKTFNDYSSELPVQFVEFSIPPEHPWRGQCIRDIVLPPGTLIALVERDGKNIVPRGGTTLEAGDRLILSASMPSELSGVHLSEIQVEAGSDVVGRRLSEIPMSDDSLVIMILRGEQVIIPRGDVSLMVGDTLVVHHRGALSTVKR